jgi:type IV pilus assembly protein PilM
MATKIVGLDLGTHTVKVCELVTTFRNFELVGFGSEPVEGPPDGSPTVTHIAEAARRLLERRGLLGETLMCALPPGYSSTVVLELPFDQPKKIEAVLPFQLDDAIPFDVEDVVYDYQIAHRTEEGSAVVLVAYVLRDVFAQFLEDLAAGGIDPKVVGVGPLSIFNLYDHILAAHEGSVAVLDLGHGHSELTIFEGGEPRIVRDIQGGGRDITVALAKAFQVDADQAERGKLAEGAIEGVSRDTQVDATAEGVSRRSLISDACRGALTPIIRDLKRSLASHNIGSGHRVDTLYLTGGTSQLGGLPAHLERALGLQVRALDPLDVPFNRLAEGDPRLRPYMAKALALSLRAFHRQHQSQLNFRKGDYAFTGDFGFLRGRVITVGVALVMMVVLAAMVAVSRKRVLEAEYLTLNNQVRALSVPILGYESDDVDLLALTVGSNIKANPIPDVSTFQVLAELSEFINFDLELDVDRLEIDLDRNKLSMQGKTKTGGDVEGVVEAIRKTKCFKGRVQKERVEKSVDGRTKFQITAQSTCT